MTQQFQPAERIEEPWNWRKLLFWSILLFALIVRSKDVSTGLPLHSLYGENEMLRILRSMLESGNFNPRQYDLPGLAYYVYLPFLYLFYLVGKLFGHFTVISSVPDASFLFIGRAVCALFGTATVYAVYKTATSCTDSGTSRTAFSSGVALLAMLILAASPQHIEFSHMLRPEIVALLFVVVAYHSAFCILQNSEPKHYRWFGFAAGCSLSLKYTIGLPLLFILLLVFLFDENRRMRTKGVVQALAIVAGVFVLTNPFLFSRAFSFDYWQNRIQTIYALGEDYYGKSIFLYYADFLSRYNYGLPLLWLAAFGISVLLVVRGRTSKQIILLFVYPTLLLLWLCSFHVVRTHGLLPIHPFIAIAAALTLRLIWQGIHRHARFWLATGAYALILIAVFYWPFYRTTTQAYLLAQRDNRSKAEIWMTNRLPQGARIAVLQHNQVELNPQYFQITNFLPHDYLPGAQPGKKFDWFRQQKFDYVVVSSGQYIRYFTEGEKARKYRQYFTDFFLEADQKGTLILDLITHPLVIPDYRIKVYSTRQRKAPPRFTPVLDEKAAPAEYALHHSGTVVSLPPGCYSLQMPDVVHGPSSIIVRNLKLNETILRKEEPGNISASGLSAFSYPFSIFPLKENSRFDLFSKSNTTISSNQIVQFNWKNGKSELVLKRVRPSIEVNTIRFSPLPAHTPARPYLLMDKHEIFHLRFSLQNHAPVNVVGYIEAFLSEIGEPQPWKRFDTSSGMQEFYLEPSQRIAINVSLSTENLTGDHQLSYWIFTRQDLPFSPQTGGIFNKQIRVKDPQLGVHPVYGVPIP